MALVKRHWKPALISLSIVVAVMVLAFVAVGLKEGPAAHAQEVAGDPVANQLDEDAWSDVRRLRRELSLDNSELAGIGCDGSRAAAVLQGVKEWYVVNQAAFRERMRAVNAARAELQRAQQRVSMGPRDEAVLRQLSDRKAAFQQAQSQRKALVDQLIPVVQSRLTQPQATAWNAVRSARAVGGFGKYVYASGLTAQQVEQLRREVGIRGRTQASAEDLAASREADRKLAEAEGRILTAGQQQEVAAGYLNGRLGIGQVVQSDATVLPMPQRTREPGLREARDGQVELAYPPVVEPPQEFNQK